MMWRSTSASLRPHCCEDAEDFNARECASIAKLADGHACLVHDAGRLDTQSEKGYEACRRFLKALDETALVLTVQAAPRTYRTHFTEKYRALFAGETRSYRVDMLEAGINLSHRPIIWANGEQYELCGSVVDCSREVQFAWVAVCGLLEHWGAGQEFGHLQPVRLRRGVFCAALRSLDEAWASFERAYVSEIMKVQEKAKHLVVEAIEWERRLRVIEERRTAQDVFELPDYREHLRKFVHCLSRLNSVANFQGKGRDDLGSSILEGAVDLLSQCESGQSCAADDVAEAAVDVARTLASRVIDAFVSLREYLTQVRGHLDQLHPQLCQNPGLVARLVEWEESWEVGARYTQSPARLSAVCRLVADIRGAQEMAPALSQMCEDFDPELFLVLPRLLWLCFLADPTKPWELMRHLLPHRFASGEELQHFAEGEQVRRIHSAPSLNSLDSRHCVPSPRVDPELQEVAKKFWSTEVRLEHSLGEASETEREAKAWEVLVRRAVGGAGAGEALYAELVPTRRALAGASVEDLMHDLERWSMELQRHSPQDWNECVGVLTQCLVGRRLKELPTEFVV